MVSADISRDDNREKGFVIVPSSTRFGFSIYTGTLFTLFPCTVHQQLAQAK